MNWRRKITTMQIHIRAASALSETKTHCFYTSLCFNFQPSQVKMIQTLLITTLLFSVHLVNAAVIDSRINTASPTLDKRQFQPYATQAPNVTDTISLGSQLNTGLDLDVLAQKGELAATNNLISLLKYEKQQDPKLYNAAKVFYTSFAIDFY